MGERQRAKEGSGYEELQSLGAVLEFVVSAQVADERWKT